MSTTQMLPPGRKSTQEPELAFKVITPTSAVREMAALEAAMQGLPLDERHPVALELAGTPGEQMWIVRATTEGALDHARRQIRARYPQVAFLPLTKDEDPLQLKEGEQVSVIELNPGAASYVPMNFWDEKSLSKEGTDPLLGVLAAIEHLPDNQRAIAQIAIVPAPTNWAGATGLRKAVEHPLEQEREQRRAEMYADRGGSFKWSTIIGLASILFGLYLFRLFHVTLPPWFLPAVNQLLHGHLPTLSGHLTMQFYGSIALLFGGLFLLYVLYDQVRKRLKGKRPIVDPRMVSQKTGQIACRVRLRLYVIGPGRKRDLRAEWRRHKPILFHHARWYRDFVRAARKAKREKVRTARQAKREAAQAAAELRKQSQRALPAWKRLQGDLPRPFLAVWRGLCRAGRHLRRAAFRFVVALWRGLRFTVCHPLQTARLVMTAPARLARRCSCALVGASCTRYVLLLGLALQKERTYRKEQATNRAAVLMRMVAAYRQFHRGGAGYFVQRPLRTRAARRIVARKRRFRLIQCGWETDVGRSTHYWSMEELSGAWHLLQAHDLPHAALVASRSARTLPIPPDVAAKASGGSVIGYSKHGDFNIPFAFTQEWLRLHGLVLGKSGEGKSTFLLHIAEAAMQQGGMVFIDPPGDNIPRILRRVPPHRASDVVVIDLSDPFFSVGLNPLDVTLGRGRDKAIADLLETLSHIWLRSWGSRMENSFEFALRTAWEANRHLVREDPQFGPGRQYTLLDILPLYTSESFCHSLLQHISDQYVHRWWREFYEPLPLYMKRDIVNPVMTKVAKFESEIARRIVGQPRSTINLTELIRQKKILLIRLAKGTVGADAAPLLGATLLGLLSICLEEQGAIEEEDRALFPILIDEFQVLEGVDWSILAQLRKYGATFFLATQSLEYLQKLDALLLPTVLANVRQIYSFNLSAQDAWTIHRELGVEAEDIINLDSHMCYVRLKLGATRRPTFSLHIEPPPAIAEEQVKLAEDIVGISQQRYATPAEEVDKWLLDAVARQRKASVGGVTIDEDKGTPVGPAPREGRTALPQAGRNGDGKSHPPRARGGSAKGPKDQRDAKPQVSTTPAGKPRSSPILFASHRVVKDKQQHGKEE
jgi:hypothetical protein